MEAEEALTRRSGGRADGSGRTDRGGKGADMVVRWTLTDKQTAGRANGRTGWLGANQVRTDGLTDWRTGRWADEGVNLGLKGARSFTPFHSLAPSPLESSESECARCLGVQWGPGGFPCLNTCTILNVPGLICLV